MSELEGTLGIIKPNASVHREENRVQDIIWQSEEHDFREWVGVGTRFRCDTDAICYDYSLDARGKEE